jgi:O-antigen/teichoic acid export membrane protein
MLDHIARFMVSRHFTVEDNAAFGVSFQYYAMADLVIYSAHVAFMNIFTREQKAVARKKYINWLKATGLLSLLGLASLWFAEPLFVMINGAQYREAYPVFAMFMAGITIYLCFSPVIYAIAERRTFKTLFVLSLAALLWQLGMTWFASEKQSLVLMAFACVSARGLIYLSSLFLYFRRA